MIAEVASTVAYSGTSSETTSPLNTTGANLIVIGGFCYTGSLAVSDSLGNTWTPLTVYTDGVVASQLFYCASPIVGASHTFTATAGYAGLYVVAVSGAAASPFDQANGSHSGSASSIQPGSITPTVSGSLVVTGLSVFERTGAVDSGFTASTGNEGAGAYLIQSSAAPINPTWSWSGGATECAAAIASFLPYVAPTPTPTPTPSPGGPGRSKVKRRLWPLSRRLDFPLPDLRKEK